MLPPACLILSFDPFFQLLTPLSHCLCVYKLAVITSISTGMATTRKCPTYLWLDPAPYIHPTSVVMNALTFGQLFCFRVLLSMQA